MSGIKETKPLSEIDPEMFKLMQQEYDRQIGGLELIASEVSASCQPSECRARARRRCPSRC
jgi:glycine/serine hydroxymethyltransferase